VHWSPGPLHTTGGTSPNSRGFQGSPTSAHDGTAAGDATRGAPRTRYWPRARRPAQDFTRRGDQHTRAGNHSPTRAPTTRRLPSEGAPSGDAVLPCSGAAGPRSRNTSGRLRRHVPGHRGPRPRNTSERSRESRLTAGFNVFSFTAGLLAPEAPGHSLFPVSSKGPVDPTDALGASEELPTTSRWSHSRGSGLQLLGS